jgi:hypothetical protein
MPDYGPGSSAANVAKIQAAVNKLHSSILTERVFHQIDHVIHVINYGKLRKLR